MIQDATILYREIQASTILYMKIQASTILYRDQRFHDLLLIDGINNVLCCFASPAVVTFSPSFSKKTQFLQKKQLF